MFPLWLWGSDAAIKRLITQHFWACLVSCTFEVAKNQLRSFIASIMLLPQACEIDCWWIPFYWCSFVNKTSVIQAFFIACESSSQSFLAFGTTRDFYSLKFERSSIVSLVLLISGQMTNFEQILQTFYCCQMKFITNLDHFPSINFKLCFLITFLLFILCKSQQCLLQLWSFIQINSTV